MNQITPLNANDYALDDMSMGDQPVFALIEKVNEIIEVVNELIKEHETKTRIPSVDGY